VGGAGVGAAVCVGAGVGAGSESTHRRFEMKYPGLHVEVH
jgi:hypothetical protein